MLINNSEFLLKEIPNFNPVLEEYEHIEFWSEQVKRNIEGYWVSGKWMPGPLYDFGNFHRGLVKSDLGNQEIGQLIIRDNDWDDFLYYEECRGFSGFELDDEFSCHRALIDPDETDETIISKFCWSIKSNSRIPLFYNNIFKPDGTRKKYVDARDYLRKFHPKSLGIPIYRNHAQNFCSFQARQAGKTMRISSMARTNFLYGGANNYANYLELIKSGNYPVSQTIMGAENTGYIATLAGYVRTALENMPGAYGWYANEYYGSPLYLPYEGAKKLGDAEGFNNIHGSRLQTRIYDGNPLASNSGRPNLAVIDEFGFIKQPDEIFASLMGSQASQTVKTIVIWCIGTGGAVKGESVKYAEKLFYNPADYNCLVFDDVWEYRGKIGNFVPITNTSWEYKDAPNYVTNIERGLAKEKKERAKLKNNKPRLEGYMINSPLMPSECFLLGDNSRFPSLLLKDHLANLLHGNQQHFLEKSRKGELKFNGLDIVEFKDIIGVNPIREYPFVGNEIDRKGCVEIFELPVTDENGEVPFLRYGGGIDPVDLAQGESLACIWIKDLLTQKLVAKYLGRTTDPKYFYEQCRRLLIFYNAKALHENNLTGIFTYFEQERSLRYLVETPSHLKSKEHVETGNTAYGYRNQGKLNDDGIDGIISWLLQPIDSHTDDLMYTTIKDPEVLMAMIKYNDKSNWDSISALIALTHYENSLVKIKKDEHKQRSDFATNYFATRKKDFGLDKYTKFAN